MDLIRKVSAHLFFKSNGEVIVGDPRPQEATIPFFEAMGR
jgi:hypothetical protein